jgi:hypothetical protein
MGFLDKLIGGGVVSAVEGVGNVVDKFVETPDEKRAWEALKLKMAQEPQIAQIELNKVEAGHRTWFVAGWRPFIGWVCGFGLAYTFLVNPMFQWWTGKDGPVLPTEIMLELVLGLLGLAGLRTYEKLKGKTR